MMTINITHHGVELTPAIRQYVKTKMESLAKYLGSIRHIDVVVGVVNHHHRKGEVYLCKVSVQVGGRILVLEKEEQDLYKAIDKVRDHLRVELGEWKKQLNE